MMLHHSRHHLSYVTGVNAAMDKLEKMRAGEGLDLDYKATMRDLSFHMAGNKLHSIFWQNMKKAKSDNSPKGALLEKIAEQFGSFEALKAEFSGAAKTVEGSGWAILVKDGDDLHIMQVQNHNLLGSIGVDVLLVPDVWEHSYYLDYKNDRGTYVDKWWDLVNWEDVSARFA